MTPILLHISDEKAQRLTQHAHEGGHESIEAYLLALIEADLNEDEDDSVEEILASIKRGFEDMLSGRTMSEAEFWHRLNSSHAESR